MSLPVFTATSFQGILKGGRNNPWLIIVDKEGTPTPYVVKLFNSNGFDSDKFTINEVLGSFLASEFDLPVPSAALIEMDEFFKRTIHDEKAFQQFELSDERIKFGCMELKGFYNFNPKAINCADAKRAIDIDTVFAFDNFIRNPDRGYIKPNLLIKKDSAFLIDHELGFDIDAGTFDNMMGQKWEPRFFEKHIFYSYLMESRKGNKENHFIAFAEYLKYLNVNKLRPFLKQLNEYGYNTAKYDLCVNYLESVKENSTNFVKLLQALTT